MPQDRYDGHNLSSQLHIRSFHCRIFPLLLALSCSLPIAIVKGQGVNIGTPPVWNFSRKDYGAATQNWDATQDNLKVMYWANNDGLLSFNGSTWTTYPVANHTIVRSVAFDQENKIYCGAQSDIGYFSPDRHGKLSYHSLVGLLPADQRNFEDVWDIVFLEDLVFFRTNKIVFTYDGQKIKTFRFPGNLEAMFVSDGKVIVQQNGSALLKFDGNSFTPFLTIAELQSAISGAIDWTGDTLLISSLKHGLFYLTGTGAGHWKTPHDKMLIEKRIYSSTLLKDGLIALGTSLDGLIVLDKKKQLYRRLNKNDGLQNNNVLHTFCDRDGNLWLGLDNGIDCVILDSDLTTIYPDGELQATAYAAAVYNGKLYLGVSNGAFVADWQPYYHPEENSHFERVPNAEGQVWGFNQVGEHLLMGHHEGAFIINEKATPISFLPGTWAYVQLNDMYMMAGTYNGLELYQKGNKEWVYDGKINGITESCRIMVKDADGAVWISHPYRGLYRVTWSAEKKYDPEIQFFDQTAGLPTNLNNYVFTVAGKAIFGTERGVYNYDKSIKKFIPDTTFNSFIGDDHRVKNMKEDKEGNIWYVTDQEVGKLFVDEIGLKKKVSKKVFPELHGKLVGGFEFIYPVDHDHVLFGAEEGFILFSDQQDSVIDSELQIIFSGIHADRNQDSLLYAGTLLQVHHPDQGGNELAANLNNLSFSFSATEYKVPYLVEYRTKLEGLEEDWSLWGKDTRRDFTNLSPGKYIFYAQARIKDGPESNVISYSFSINPPWYKSNPAFAMYSVCFLSVFAGFVMRQRKKFETEKTQMTKSHLEKEAAHLREVEKSKAALSEIQNEKLEVEIKYKNQELATTTLHLVQKAEILLSIQEGLHQIREKNTNPLVKKDIQQLLNLINFDVKLDEDWEHFAHHFDQVHVDFLKQLRDQFPQLSSSDFRLCAYLRMNLSTKEIAPLLNISVRGVEGSRYRLRKKLNLPNDANLTEFILRLPVSKN